jgi:Glycosyltransferases involved in cell wall biogenesis
MQKILIVLPAYNEEVDLPVLLSKFESLYTNTKLNLEILVVNDGSSDNTAGIAENFSKEIKIQVLNFETNRGLGAVLKDGLRYAVGQLNPDDIVITMDSDNSHNPYLIIRMVQQIREGSELVIASRYQHGAKTIGLIWYRKLFSFIASVLFRTFAPISGNVKDFTCGYRAYKVSLLQKAFKEYGDKIITETGFSSMSELLLNLSVFNPIAQELPMILRYDFKQGVSKMNLKNNILKTLNVIYRYRAGNRKINSNRG